MRLSHWVLGLAVIAVCGVGTVWLLTPGEADRLREKNEALAHEKAELQRAIERLTAQTRLADVYVLEQSLEADGVTSTLQFVEWDFLGHTGEYLRTGQPLDLHASISQDEWGLYQRGMRSAASTWDSNVEVS